MPEEAQDNGAPIPPDLLRESFQTAFEVLEQLIHEIGDPPRIVRKFNALMLAVAGK
jgi:hypothetical protein